MGVGYNWPLSSQTGLRPAQGQKINKKRKHNMVRGSKNRTGMQPSAIVSSLVYFVLLVKVNTVDFFFFSLPIIST
jgi:hypothetical protein